MTRAVIGIGSSLGDRLGVMSLAVSALHLSPGVSVCRGSRLYESPPWGGVARQAFLNAAILLHSDLCPSALLELCQSIEKRLGRKVGLRWTDRVLDLDLLWMEGIVQTEVGWSVPHPRLGDRLFALYPLLELVPDASDPEGIPYKNLLVGAGKISTTGVLACGMQAAYPRV